MPRHAALPRHVMRRRLMRYALLLPRLAALPAVDYALFRHALTPRRRC